MLRIFLYFPLVLIHITVVAMATVLGLLSLIWVFFFFLIVLKLLIARLELQSLVSYGLGCNTRLAHKGSESVKRQEGAY